MSVQLISWAYAQTVGSPTEKAVLISLANRANHDTGHCNPHLKTVAAETELSYATVKRCAASLVEKNFIERKRIRRQDGSLTGYIYIFPRLTLSPPGLAVSPSPGLAVSPHEPEEDLEPEEPLAKAVSRTPPSRKRDPIWDCLTDIFGDATTETKRSLRGKVCRSLRNAGATPDEIVKRSRAWPRHFEGATFTELALEKHWDTLGRPPLRQRR